MTWISALIDTYDMLREDSSAPDRGTLFFRYISAQPAWIVTVTAAGDFAGAREVPPKNPALIPCTETSGSRSSGIDGHPVCDNLQYIAGNSAILTKEFFQNLTQDDREFFEKIFRKMKGGYRDFLEKQEAWLAWIEREGEPKNPMLEAVHKYVTSHDVIADLASVLEPAKDLIARASRLYETSPAARKKFQEDFQAFLKGLVYFECPELPEEQGVSGSLMADSWNRYCDSRHGKGEFRLCPVTGNSAIPAAGYPRKIRFDADLTRLVSMGDTTGLTFRGRYRGPDDLTKISEDASQKIHKALSWLIRHCSTHFGGQYTVIWAPGFSGRIPSPLKRRDYPPKKQEGEESYGEEQDSAKYAWPEIWPEGLSPEQRICVMAVDSLSKGRLSLAMWEETDAASYRERMESWISDLEIGSSSGDMHFPDISRIIADLCGNTGGGKFHSLILRAALDGGPFPEDLMRKFLRKVMADSPREDVRNAVRTAASLVKACEIRNNGRRIGVMLDTELRDRSYLFGRLLAIADNMEGYVLLKHRDNGVTAAMRYMQQFSVMPASVWKNLELAIGRSQRSLSFQQETRGFLVARQKLMDEILGLFSPEDFASDAPLDPIFLLGFHHQRCALLQKKAGEPEDKAE